MVLKWQQMSNCAVACRAYSQIRLVTQEQNIRYQINNVCCVITVLTVASSIFTLTALSIDHYTAVRSPRRRDTSLDSGQRRTVVLLVVIWLVAAALSGPVLHVRHVTKPDLGTDKVIVDSFSWVSLESTGSFTFSIVVMYTVPYTTSHCSLHLIS